MAHISTPDSREETARRGREWYQSGIRAIVETAENIGKIAAIDTVSGDYEIGDDVVMVGQRLRGRRPDANIWFERIGYDAVFAVGGTLTRTGE